MQKQVKTYLILIILISVLIAPSFALAAWWNPLSWNWNIFNIFSKPQTSTTQPATSQGGQNQQGQTNNTDQTINWQTYSDYGISFKYPAEMGQPRVNKLGTGASIGFKNSVIFTINSYYDKSLGRNATFNEVVNSSISDTSAGQLSRKNITVDGKDGVEIAFTGGSTSNGVTTIYVPIDEKGNILVAIEYAQAVAHVGGVGLDKIIPTLKFTK